MAKITKQGESYIHPLIEKIVRPEFHSMVSKVSVMDNGVDGGGGFYSHFLEVEFKIVVDTDLLGLSEVALTTHPLIKEIKVKRKKSDEEAIKYIDEKLMRGCYDK